MVFQELEEFMDHSRINDVILFHEHCSQKGQMNEAKE